MSMVTRAVCKSFIYPTPFELHFSAMHLGWYRNDPDDYVQNMNGTDADLAAHFTIIGKRGKCLYGAPIADVFADVPKHHYFDSIWNDIAEAAEDIAENTMYLTLHLTRVLAYAQEELVLSKKEGGEWALQKLPMEYHDLIRAALREYEEGIHVTYDELLAKQYAHYMLQQIQLGSYSRALGESHSPYAHI